MTVVKDNAAKQCTCQQELALRAKTTASLVLIAAVVLGAVMAFTALAASNSTVLAGLKMSTYHASPGVLASLDAPASLASIRVSCVCARREPMITSVKPARIRTLNERL